MLSPEMIAQLCDKILVLEDVVHNGCFGHNVIEAVDGQKEVRCCNTGNRFLPHGSVAEVYADCGIDGAHVAAQIQQWLNSK